MPKRSNSIMATINVVIEISVLKIVNEVASVVFKVSSLVLVKKGNSESKMQVSIETDIWVLVIFFN